MMIMNSKMRSTAIAALLGLPLATGAAVAQESQEADQTQQSTEQTQQQPEQSGLASSAVVATVGTAEILGSDVMTFIGALPPQVQSQPPQMLLPMALDQLILRELILEDARGQNLADDPEVVALVGASTEVAEEDAMVQVWLDRQMANVVTDEAVQQAYDEAKAQGQENLPPVEEVRPQIEQYLLQQAMQNIGMQLREGAQIVLFDATGQPIEQQQGQAAQGDGGDAATSSEQSSSDNASESTSESQSTDGSSGSSETSDTEATED